MIEVCCAIITKGSKILAVQRGQESSHPWLWEFPGGKIYPGETATECIIREIEEELSVRIEVLSSLASIEFDYGSKQIHLIPFICKIVSGELVLTEHIAKQWFSPDDWRNLDWSGADHKLILKNQEILKSLM